MKKQVLFGSVFIALTMASCGAYSKMTTRNNKTDQVKTISPITYPVLMDLDINLTKKAKGNSAGIVTYVLTEDYYKQVALSQAIIAANCDVLIEPTYFITKSVTKKGNKSIVNIEVEVSGYPANYKNPRNINPSDTSMIKFMTGGGSSAPQIKTLAPSNPVKKNEGGVIY